jgi:hypothetical protein
MARDLPSGTELIFWQIVPPEGWEVVRLLPHGAVLARRA